MSSFTKPLIVKFLDREDVIKWYQVWKWFKTYKWFELYEEFEFYMDWEEGIRQIITVPKGFRTDFASIPLPLRVILSPIGRHGKAAVLHDYLCEYGTMSRKDADRVFLEAMKVKDVGWIKKRVMYRGVRVYSVVSGAKAGYKNEKRK